MKKYDNPEIFESDEDFTVDSFVAHIVMELLMGHIHGKTIRTCVKKRLKDNDRNPIGRENKSLIMNR